MAQKYSGTSGASETNAETFETAPQQQERNYPQQTDRSQADTLDLGTPAPSGRMASDVAAQGPGNPGAGNGPLLRDPENLRQRWESIQVGFVDNPREAVGEAEELVSSTIGQIANVFRQQRERLEGSWAQGREPSTDDLRVTFQSYRDFFGRLLQV